MKAKAKKPSKGAKAMPKMSMSAGPVEPDADEMLDAHADSFARTAVNAHPQVQQMRKEMKQAVLSQAKGGSPAGFKSFLSGKGRPDKPAARKGRY